MSVESDALECACTEELTYEGHKVITASSPFNLLEKIEIEKPHLVILDIKLMDYNGLDLLQNIKNRVYDLPVGILS